MNSFCLAYVNNSADLEDVFFQEPVWKTCLRTIVCFDEQRLEVVLSRSSQNNLNLILLKECEAYQYLLEVICGLKSEIIGETQVLGQFKTFLNETEKNHRHYYLNHYSLFQNLLQDCKELREKHIHHWGGSSYGSLTRKIIETTDNICVLGNGQLAQSLIPWMKEKKSYIFGRSPKNSGEQFLSIDVIRNAVENTGLKTSLVIAAPIANDFLKSLLGTVTFQQIIDWRSESCIETGDLPVNSGYHSFKHLAHFMQNEKLKKQKHLDALGEIITQKINTWSDRKLHRPKGWDDLC